jgi:hypothetical protein
VRLHVRDNQAVKQGDVLHPHPRGAARPSAARHLTRRTAPQATGPPPAQGAQGGFGRDGGDGGAADAEQWVLRPLAEAQDLSRLELEWLLSLR